MEKNENGYPRVGGVTDSRVRSGTTRPGNGCSGMGNMGGNVGGTTDMNDGMNNGMGNTGAHNHTCGGDGSCLDAMPLAYVYAPSQQFRLLYSAKDALKHGTLFEELYKPMEVYGRE